MQCPRCRFENLPGQKTCFRCGSVMEGSGAVQVHPPRAARWKLPLRRVLYAVRRWTGLGKIEKAASELRVAAEHLDRGLQRGQLAPGLYPPSLGAQALVLFRQSLFWILVSGVPGLGHLLQRRFRSIRWWAVGWLGQIAFALFIICPEPLPVATLIFAIFLHAWIACDAGLVVQRCATFGLRAFALVVTAGYVFLLYWGIRATAFRPFVLGQAMVSVPSRRVEVSDHLLCRRLRPTDEIRRGDLLLIRYEGSEAVSQVIGLPGERVRAEGGRFLVNDTALSVEEFPVPGNWRGAVTLRAEGAAQDAVAVLGPEQYYVRWRYEYVYGGLGGRRRSSRPGVEGSAMVGRRQVVARAFLRWMPLQRRGRL